MWLVVTALTPIGDVVLLLRSSSSQPVNDSQIVVIHPNGSFEHVAIELPTENMVQNGMYALFDVNLALMYIEVGSSTTVSVLVFDVSEIV